MSIESLKKANQLLKALKEAKLNEDKDKTEETEAMKLLAQMQGQESIIEAIKENRLTKEDIREALSELKISPQINVNVPDIKVPDIKIPEIKSPTIPEIKIPEIKIPEIKIPKIEVPKIPEIKIPEIKIPDIKMPGEMKVSGDVGLKGFGMDNPLPVQLRDAKGKPLELNFGGSNAGGGSNSKFLKNKDNQTINPATEETLSDNLQNYKISDIDDVTATTYLGYLRKDGAWYIQKTTSAGAVTYAAGASGYNFANRASETYNLFNITF